MVEASIQLLVTGREIGRGSDGEPLLADAAAVATLTYDRARSGYVRA